MILEIKEERPLHNPIISAISADRLEETYLTIFSIQALKTSDLKEIFRNYINRNTLQWIFLFTISMVIFLSHNYNDLLITTRQGINLWNNLFSGHIIDFYTLNNNIQSGNIYYTHPQGAAYDFSMYLVFAFWNFPLWILENTFHVDIMNIPACLIWSKLMLVFFLFLSARILRKIAIELGFDAKTTQMTVFTYLSSAFVFSSIYIMSQYDIICIVFTLLGVLAFLRGRMRNMVIWFALANSFKLFALFVFVPLLLLREKRIWKIATGLALVSSIVLAQKLVFFIFSKNINLASQNSFLSFLTTNSLQMGTGSVPLFFLGTILLYLYCYTRETGDLETFRRQAIYAGFLGLANFFVLAFSYPYWIILWVPFIVLLMFQNIDRLKYSLVIEMMMSFAMIIAQMLKFDWCFGIKTIQPMLLPLIFGKVETLSLNLQVGQFHKLGSALTNLALSSALSVFAAATIVLALYNRPERRQVLTALGKSETMLLEMRLVFGSMICLLPILLYLVSVGYTYLSQ